MVSVPWQHGQVPQPHSGKGAGLSCFLHVLLWALDQQVRVGRACGRLLKTCLSVYEVTHSSAHKVNTV